MMFLELFVPRGMFDADRLRVLAERLTMKQLITHADAIQDVDGAAEVGSANAGVLDFLGSINHVVVHEIGTWIVDGRPLAPGGAPRYVARVAVPGPWRKSMSAFLIAAVTRALSQLEPDRERYYLEPAIEVQVIGVPDGGYGVSGRPTGEAELLGMIAGAKDDGTIPQDSRALVDPVCGMVASDSVSTLEHDGTIYGFCSPGCRQHFITSIVE